MIGIKYLKYHPKVIFQIPSGLTIYESVFENAVGGRRVIREPQKAFKNIRRYQPRETCKLHSFQISISYREIDIK